MKRIDRACADEIVKIIRRKRIGRRFGKKYYNVVFCLDLECTSFIYGHSSKGEPYKVGYCYIWTISVDGNVYYGRQLKSLRGLLNYLTLKLKLSEDKRIIVFCHNQSYDFQFYRKYFKFDKVLARDDRHIIFANTVSGIEFRCSYMLSGYSIDELGESLGLPKLSGQKFDYNKPRNSLTPLTEFEMNYCRRDVEIQHLYLAEKAEQEGGVHKFELTKTGYVRTYLRNRTIYNKKYAAEYRELMRRLPLDERQYKLLHAAFAGGYTHANACHSQVTLTEPMESYDIQSDYPSIIVSEKFPMEIVELECNNEAEFYKLLESYACVMHIKLYNVSKKIDNETYLSYDKLLTKIGVSWVDNGRVDSAQEVDIIFTDVDFRIFEQCYNYTRISIMDVVWFRYEYLPKAFIEATLKLYEDKTLLKGVKGKEKEYLLVKELINSIYGGCVQDIVPEELPYIDDEWGEKHKGDIKEYLEKYNEGKRRCTAYQWGVWITAYGRKRLWECILARPEQYVYSDTDSMKMFYDKDNRKIINMLNNNMKQKLLKMCEYYNIDFNKCQPRGYMIGAFALETIITRFKTLGSKRYMTEGYEVTRENEKFVVSKEKQIKLTCSGIGKRKGMLYLRKQALRYELLTKRNKNDKTDINGKIFDLFHLGTIFPPEAVDKLEHGYIDKNVKTILTDYLGNSQEIESPSSVYLAPTTYKLKMNGEYDKYIAFITALTGRNKGF